MLTDECANLEHNQAVAVAGRGTLRPGRRVRFEKKTRFATHISLCCSAWASKRNPWEIAPAP